MFGKAWEHIPKPIEKPKPFLCFKPFHSSCQEAAFTAATNRITPKERKQLWKAFFFPLQVTASILADSYLFSATSHLPEHHQKCSNYCQLSLGSHRRQGQAGRPPDSWMLNSDESFGWEGFSSHGTVFVVYLLQSLHWHTNEAGAHLITGCCNKIQVGT